MAVVKPHRDRGRYTNDLTAVARHAANMLLLRPLVWRVTKVTVHGRENLDGLDGAYVVVANHSSHLDTPLIFGSLPKRLSKYLATGAAADYFFTAWWRAMTPVLFFNAFPVDRGKGRARQHHHRDERSHRGMAGSLLTDGIPLLIFPEGSRSRTGAMGTFKPGAAALAISRGVPVVPVALVGAFSAMPSDTGGLPKGRPPVHVVYGHPMDPTPGEIAHEFSERVRRQVIELHDQTARAYGMPTLSEYARTLALEKARTVTELPDEPQAEPAGQMSRPDQTARAEDRPPARDEHESDGHEGDADRPGGEQR